MDRIKDITKIKLPDDALLMEVVKKDKGIILIGKENEIDYDYLVIIGKGKIVDDYNIGDIVLRTVLSSVEGLEIKGKAYAICRRHAVKIAVDPYNFDKSFKKPVSNILKN
jgi:hypothetical protein